MVKRAGRVKFKSLTLPFFTAHFLKIRFAYRSFLAFQKLNLDSSFIHHAKKRARLRSDGSDFLKACEFAKERENPNIHRRTSLKLSSAFLFLT